MDTRNNTEVEDNFRDDTYNSDNTARSNPIPSSPAQDPVIAIPTLEEALHASEASTNDPIASRTASISRNIQNLTLTTTNPHPQTDPSLKSETSSIVPTSARLSIATTHQELRFHPAINGIDNDSSNGNVSTMLDSILANPGWNVATRGGRRNSLFSMRSLAPTLPPYEDLRVPQQPEQEGEEDLRVGVAVGDGEKCQRSHSGGSIGGDHVADEGDADNDGGRGNSGGGGERASESPPQEPSSPVPEDAETENALSAHYSRIVRTIDSRYTSELERLRQEIAALQQSHAEELALMRNNIDAAYRDVLKKRNKEVEKAKESAASRAEELEKEVQRWKVETEGKVAILERENEVERERMAERHQMEVERERNAVEDVWERRWRERMDLVEEEAGGRVGRRDEEWLMFLGATYPEVCKKAREVMMPAADEASV